MTPDIAPRHIDLAATADFAIGGAQVRPSVREIEFGGAVQLLEPRVMQVLVLLSEMTGRTVSRNLMVERCWGGVVVGEDAIQRCIGRLRKVAAETGAFEIGTVKRVGYKLITHGDSASQVRVEVLEKRSIAVLNFRVVHPNGDDAIFAECLADDICAALASHRDMAVVTRAISSAVIDNMSDLSNIGTVFGTRYAAGGSIRPSDAGRRITIQLFDTDTAQILWSHQRDVPISDSYPSDELLLDLTGRLVVHMMHDESDRAMQKSSDITAWEAVIRSNSAYRRVTTETLHFAVSEARRAVDLAPEYGAAHAALANALGFIFEVGGGVDPATASEAEAHCERAMALDPDNPAVLTSVGNALGMIGQAQQGFPLLERAVELAPTHIRANLNLARGYLRQQRPEDALSALDTHDRIAPQCYWHSVLYTQSLAHFMAGRLTDAEEALDQSLIVNPNYPYAWVSKAVLMMVMHRPKDARDAAERLRRLEGTDSLSLQLNRIANGYPDRDRRAVLQSLFRTAWDGVDGPGDL